MELKVFEFEAGVRRAARSGAGALVIIDALRASATVCALVSRGATVRPFAKLDDAVSKRQEGWLVAADFQAQRAPGADIDNSPTGALGLAEAEVRGRQVAFHSTNGAKLMAAALPEDVCGVATVLIGSFVNARALVDELTRTGQKNVALVAAGSNGERALEDYVCAQYLHGLLSGDTATAEFLHGNFHEQMVNAYPDIEERGLMADVQLCLKPDSIPVVPTLKSGMFGV